MSLSLVTGPETEPVTLDEAKDHLRLTTDDENDLIEALIVSAREYAETFTHRAFLTQTWDEKLDAFPDVLEVPLPPLQITPTAPVITYVDTAGATQTLSASLYTIDAPTGPHARPARIVPAYGLTWPSTRDVPNAVTVRFVAGYGLAAGSVPALIRLAMKEHIRMNWLRGDGADAILTWVNTQLWTFKAF